MKIREIRCAGLRGATPEGGWSNELRPEDCVHTLVAVHTDQGLAGIGSVFSNDQLVRAALAVLEPLYRGENALEPERVSEKLHQNTFWLGRGGSITHAISPDSLLMVDAVASDAFWSQRYQWAVRTAERLADSDVTWFEEPLRPHAMNDYVELRRPSPVPIAGGEVFTRRQSFQPWLHAC